MASGSGKGECDGGRLLSKYFLCISENRTMKLIEIVI
jgi:hypothetical protein